MTSPDAKRRRQRAILELVQARPFGSQEALGEALADRGHEVTQSTLSRDLKELRIARVPGRDGYRYVPARDYERPSAAGTYDVGDLAGAEVLEVAANEVTVVLRTRIGRAQGVAVFLDRTRPEGVLATVAGDDTVLVVPESIHEVDAVATRLAELFGSAAVAGRAPRRQRTFR